MYPLQEILILKIMVRRTKNKSIKPNQKKNNIFRFSAISLLVIFSFFTLPTLINFLDKNLNFKKSIISNAGVNFDQELEKRKFRNYTRSKDI